MHPFLRVVGWAQALVNDDGGGSPWTPDAHAGRRMLDAGQRWTPDAFDKTLEPLHEGQVLETPELPVENVTFQVTRVCKYVCEPYIRALLGTTFQVTKVHISMEKLSLSRELNGVGARASPRGPSSRHPELPVENVTFQVFSCSLLLSA